MRRHNLGVLAMTASLALAGAANPIIEPRTEPGEGRRNRPAPADHNPAFNRKTPATAGDFAALSSAEFKRFRKNTKRASDWAHHAKTYYRLNGRNSVTGLPL